MARQPRSVLFVHAHPDDETISTGGTIATLVDAGAAVTVLSCTRGECGEVIPAELASLEGDGPALAEHRTEELAQAMRILGVTDHRFLGEENARLLGREPRVYRDSGMLWGESGPVPVADQHAESLCAASLDEVADDIAEVIMDTQPSAVVSYDANGGYGHPDHVVAHRAALMAAEATGVPFYSVEEQSGAGEAADADDSVYSVDVSAVVQRKAEAMRAHRTQITVEGDRFALSSGPSRPIQGVEMFRRWSNESVEEEIGAETSGASFREGSLGAQIFTAGLSLLLGLGVGALGTVTHQAHISLAALDLPVGVVLALVVVTAQLGGLRLVFGSRVPALLAAVGVMVAIMVFGQVGPGGSVLIPANGDGYVWSYGAPLIAAIILAWPRTTPRAER